jgi:hypothetical protein
MSASPSRRDLLRGLLAAGLAWVGLPRAAKAAPVMPPQPLTNATSRLTGCYYYCYDDSGSVTTMVYDIRDRMVVDQSGPCLTVTYSYDSTGLVPPPQPPQKS